ncbi:hypothetical protein NIIDMKKI_79210 [Mycobacterium kansasii]|uniref:Uncharacterized protein n=1 Tax=Mycobacterium kansasii TaxID=1768 RepID=A0A7G1ISE4_MYCKA|nr:hypothetical protein NIIDMKKI_79210 [Mycobacterium kansasii]
MSADTAQAEPQPAGDTAIATVSAGPAGPNCGPTIPARAAPVCTEEWHVPQAAVAAGSANAAGPGGRPTSPAGSAERYPEPEEIKTVDKTAVASGTGASGGSCPAGAARTAKVQRDRREAVGNADTAFTAVTATGTRTAMTAGTCDGDIDSEGRWPRPRRRYRRVPRRPWTRHHRRHRPRPR